MKKNTDNYLILINILHLPKLINRKINCTMKIGDSVIIIDGTFDPDFEKYDMSGWQGRIIEIYDIDGIDFEIALDSITLKQVPRRYILDNLKEGNDYAIMYVSSVDVVKTEPRDTEDEVRAVRLSLNKELNYVSTLDEDETLNEFDTFNILLELKDRKIHNNDLKHPCLN